MSLFDDIAQESPRPPASKPTLQTISYTHDAMIDEILINPSISQGDLARKFGYTECWISIVKNSDAFQERLAERKAEIIDPRLRATIEDKVIGAANRAMDRLIDRIESPTHGAIKTQDLISIAKLFVQPRTPAPVATQNNLYVVSLPGPAPDSKSWLETASRAMTPRGPSEIIENAPRG